jgi:hypothetical protein
VEQALSDSIHSLSNSQEWGKVKGGICWGWLELRVYCVQLFGFAGASSYSDAPLS